MRDNVENQNKHRNNGRHKNEAMSEALQKVGVTPSNVKRNDKHIEEQANYAIASNLAYSQLVQLLGCKDTRQVGPELKELSNEINTLSALIMYRRECAENEKEVDAQKIQDFNATLTKFNTHAAGFEKLWARIMRPLSEERRPYFSADERKLLMCELMCLCERLRNRFSHWIPVPAKREQVLDLTGKAQFSNFLELLYQQASSRLSLQQWFSLINTKPDSTDQTKKLFALNEEYGSAFIFSLFNTRSQMQRLMQGLKLKIAFKSELRKLRRRENQLYQFYARRDGYSETQLDPKSALLREIMGYLNLPPLESAAGQKEKEEWDKKQKKMSKDAYSNNDFLTPQFRRDSKHIQYALQTLDALQLLPEWKFAGHTQLLAEGSDDEGSLWESPSDSEKDIPSKHGHALRSKLGILTQYGRNFKQPENHRFAYDLRGPNLRFQLTVDNKAVSGVIRERDFCNLVYFALTKPLDTQAITQYAYQWLEQYQHTLTHADSNWVDKLQTNSELKAKNYPRQIQWKIQNTAPDLFSRLNKSVEARLGRLHKIDAQCILPKRDKSGKKEKRSENDLPRHEKIHELLHIFIRHLNANGRSKVTQKEYGHLQQLLLNYKGDDNKHVIRAIKGEQPGTSLVHHYPLASKAAFWQHLHHTYTPELVNADSHGGKTHPIWVHCLVKGKRKDRKGKEIETEDIPSLDKLFKLFLLAEIEDLKREQRHLQKSKNNPTELQQIAFRLQVSLMDERNVVAPGKPVTGTAGETVEPPKHGYEKSCHDALHYSVLPASICQQALKLDYKEEIALNKSGTEFRYPSIATLIREHHCERSLIAEFYDPALVQAQAHKKLQEHGKLNCLFDEEKANWKKCVQALNDWNTKDKLCLLMIGQLAKQATVKLGTGSVRDFYSQPVIIKLNGQDHHGNSRAVSLKLSNSLQTTRHWFAWPTNKLERALCWHNDQDAQVDAVNIQTMVIAYQQRAKEVIEQVLMLEKSVFERLSKINNPILIDIVKKDGYANFQTILSQMNNWENEHKDVLRYLRNSSLHDALPQQDFLLKLYPDQVKSASVLDVRQLGAPQLEQIKNGIQANRN